MKKLIFILIILMLTSILITSSSCLTQVNATPSTVKEAEQTKPSTTTDPGQTETSTVKEAEQTEFNKTKEEIIKFDTEYWQIWTDYRQGDAAKNLKVGQVPIEDWDKFIAAYREYVSNFRRLTIPEPLDEFYFKKIEHMNKVISMLTNWATDKEESDKAMGEADELSLEAQKLLREVYREYGLDDLIIKWQ